MKVYVVTSGEYSDFHIVGIFSTEELAIKMCDVYGDADYYEEMVDKLADRADSGCKLFDVHYSVSELYPYKRKLEGKIDNKNYSVNSSDSSIEVPFDAIENTGVVRFWAKSAEQAEKIFIDKYWLLKANGNDL